MESRYINRYNTFCRSLKNPVKSLKADPKADFVLEGCRCLRREITWRMLKTELLQQKSFRIL